MATFTFDGREIKLIDQHVLELGDLAFIREHFDISGLVALEQQMGNMEPGAWRAILIASIRRVMPDVAPDHPGVDDVAILPLISDLNLERSERMEAASDQEGRTRPTKGSKRKATRAPSGTRT